jgi:hypothetical protein
MAIEGFTGSLSMSFARSTSASSWSSLVRAHDTLHANTYVHLDDVIPEVYASFAQPILVGFVHPGLLTTEADVAEAVRCAAKYEPGHLRFPAGPDVVALVHE